MFAKMPSSCSPVVSLLVLESMLANEFLIEKLERFAYAFIEISLLYKTTNQNERNFVNSIMPI